MRSRVFATCVVVVATAAAAASIGSGCSTPAAYLSAPASEADLINDGSADAQKKLHDKYALTVVEPSSLFDDQGTKLRNVGGTDLVSLQDRNAADVLSRNAESGEAINNWAFGMSTLGS